MSVPKIYFCLPLFWICIGCHSYSTYELPKNYHYSPFELAIIQMNQRVKPRACQAISTTWTNSQSCVYTLLNKTTFDFKDLGNLLIVENGTTNGALAHLRDFNDLANMPAIKPCETNDGIVVALDFYWEKETGDDQHALLFVGHDYIPGTIVTSVRPRESDGRGLINITRQQIDFGTNKCKWMYYRWQWNRNGDHAMIIDPDTWFSE
jgi:hypothetical protein